LIIVIKGELAEYIEIKHTKLEEDTPVDRIHKKMSIIGEKCMTEEYTWPSTIKTVKKSLLLSLPKKDLIEVLEYVKVIKQSNKQSFLIKT
jgi:hypothetical protein